MDILNLTTLLFATRCDLDPRSSYQPDYGNNLFNGQIFDFIVVGGGTAGAIVANRLSENPNWRVLLLEAGGHPTVTSEIPAYFSRMFGSDSDWKYELEPGLNHSLAFVNGRSILPRGKILGGTGSINGMVYCRGLSSDYDSWARSGNTGWNWDNVLKYYKKAEKATGRTSNNFGTNGPFTISRPTIDDNPMYDMLLQSAKEAKIPVLYEEGNIGVFDAFLAITNGTRSSTAKGYLSDMHRNNLAIVTNAHVTKIIIKRKTATGVEVIVGGKTIQIKARKDVVLSAGTVNTPQILMLSGIGPKEHLKQLGIQLEKDLPVGNNLQDHHMLMGQGLSIKIVPPNEPNNVCLTDSVLNYCIKREGPLSTFTERSTQWSFSTENKPDPNVQMYFIYYPKGSDATISNAMRDRGMNNVTYLSAGKISTEYHLIAPFIFVSVPKSTGTVRLQSKDPFKKPLVYPNYLSDKNNDDLKILKAAIVYIKDLLKTPTMRLYKAQFSRVSIPNCDRITYDSDDYWDCVVRNIGTTGCHLVGTCKMGPSNDTEAVVDSRLRVYGIQNLRVVDASTMPTVTGRNTNAPTIMIGEKGADMIKEDWRWKF